MITNCPVCGKAFDVLWPQLWRYRRGQLFICSWKCLRLFDDGKEGKGMGKLTLEIKKKAVQTAIDGGDPLKYLADCGYTAPDKMWYYIKNTLKEKDPELFAKIPDLRKGKKPEIPEIPEPVSGGPWEKAEMPEQTVAKAPEAEEKRPINQIGYTICGIEGEFGRFFYDRKFNRLDWTTPEGEEVSMDPVHWRIFVKQMPRVLEVLMAEVAK